VLADRQRLLGSDHPDTVSSQSALTELTVPHRDQAN
jgi:hypothetical protein